MISTHSKKLQTFKDTEMTKIELEFNPESLKEKGGYWGDHFFFHLEFSI